ncbi:Hsp20/alpha crystallin family protein [Phytoactinopolyspora halotolerans]|uniref:Hsp20/alpha crystallin family protein n=1 Tax=Phytoactinopolyspora halotolerans TaxID=1981512 RepID=A0A6L9S1B4_9ACTN|nr:Hsp20/alpha crystallin family protein [Phytoactinopolyspora halotolerans]NED98975.1 Hsp20/alpha crystallin family protein [Phytoactinopolyspora halotolerans]
MTTTLTLRPLADVDRLFQTFWNAPADAGAFTPSADVHRNGDDLVARFDLPGVDPEEDVTVEVQGRRLIVRGERKDSRDEERDGYRLREVRYGSFQRSVVLPVAADPEKVSAGYDAGVLTVTVADVYAGTAPRRIAITKTA